MVPLLKDDFLILLGRDAQKIEELYASHPQKAIYEIDRAEPLHELAAERGSEWRRVNCPHPVYPIVG